MSCCLNKGTVSHLNECPAKQERYKISPKGMPYCLARVQAATHCTPLTRREVRVIAPFRKHSTIPLFLLTSYPKSSAVMIRYFSLVAMLDVADMLVDIALSGSGSNLCLSSHVGCGRHVC